MKAFSTSGAINFSLNYCFMLSAWSAKQRYADLYSVCLENILLMC